MSMNFATDVVVNASNSLQTKILKAPTTSGGSTYGAGTSGQVLITNGTSIYWGTPSLFAYRPSYQASVSDNTIQPLINDLRANHLAFLPADQIIIEQTTDGGTTWESAGVADSTKIGLFSETRPSISLPRINGEKNILCGLRITFTAMKYNVPANTSETSKYDYWNDQYIVSTERYNNIREMYFWINSGADKIKIKIERATGKNPNNWSIAFEDNNALFSGWSGNDYIKLNVNSTFGGGTTQNTNYWNYRVTFMSAYNSGASAFTASSITSAQGISEIRGYGTCWWTRGNSYASSDHMYSWDYQKNVIFPAKITATDYVGKINGTTVPSNPVFTDEKLALTTTITNGVAYYPVLSDYTSTAERKCISGNFRFIHNSDSDALQLGQVSSSSTASSKIIFCTGPYYARLAPPAYTSVSASNDYTLPSAGGTLALTSDIPTRYNSSNNTTGYLTMADLPLYDGSVT